MSTGRFPDEVAAVLTAAGWHQGRDIGEQAAQMVERTVALAAEAGHELRPFPAALAALHEFGGLLVTRKSTGLKFQGDNFQVDSAEVAKAVRKFAAITRKTGQACFPLGAELDEHCAFAMVEDGRAFLLHHTGDYVLGASMDEALVTLITTSGPLPELFDRPAGADGAAGSGDAAGSAGSAPGTEA